MELMPIRVKFRGETPDLEIAPESFLRFEIDLGHGAQHGSRGSSRCGTSTTSQPPAFS